MANLKDDQYSNQNPVTPEPDMDAPKVDETPEEKNRPETVDAMLQEEIIQFVMGRFQSSKEWREPYRQDWDEDVEHYEQQYNDTDKEDWQARVFQPMITTYVERATASLHNMSMGADVPVEYKPRNSKDDPQIEDTNEIIQHDLEKMDFKVHWTDFLRINCLHGTAVAKVGYTKEKETVMVKKRKKALFDGMFLKLGSMFGFDSVEQTQDEFLPEEKIVKDHSDFKACDLYDIYPQPHIEDFTKDTWVIEKFKVTNKELVRGYENPDMFLRLENVTPELLNSGTSETNRDEQKQVKETVQQDFEVSQNFVNPDLEHTGYEYWGPMPLYFVEPEARYDEYKKHETVNGWIWVIDGRWLVRKQLTPHMDGKPPYIKGNYIRRPGHFYGIGVGKLLNGLQDEKNEIRNTRADNINLMLNKIIGVIKDKVPKEERERLISEPGAIWSFTGIDDIRKAIMPIDMPDVTPDSWRGSAEVDREAQEVTDIIKTTQTINAGEDQAGSGTFRGQLLNRQVQNERFTLYARILEIMGLNSVIEKIYERIYQFKSYAQIEKILGPERAKQYELPHPTDLAHKASLISLGALTNENKGLKLAQMRDFYVVFQQEPFMKKIDFARKMYRMMSVGSDPDEVLWSDEEFKQFNQAKREMLSETEGLIGGKGGGPGGPGGPGVNPTGLGSEPAGPVAGDEPGKEPGIPRESLPPAGPGANSIDMTGSPVS